jgi:hypothetical protein
MTKTFQLLVAVCMFVGVGQLASAEVLRVTSFAGEVSETFDGRPQIPYFVIDDLLDDTARLTPVVENFFQARYWQHSQSGDQFGFAHNGGVRIAFDQPVSRFGGYFYPPGYIPWTPAPLIGEAIFFGVDGSELGRDDILIEYGSSLPWTWNGWTASAPIASVTLHGLSFPWEELSMDSLQASRNVVPEPETLALLGVGFAALVLLSIRRKAVSAILLSMSRPPWSVASPKGSTSTCRSRHFGKARCW